MQKKKTHLLALLLTLVLTATANTSLFEPVQYASYHPASFRSNYSFIETGIINQFSSSYYLEKEQAYPVISTRFAFDMPVLSVQQETHAWAIILPIQNTLIIDMYENKSAPLLNNDYLFGLAIQYTQDLNLLFIENFSVRATPFFHESTHIGDEYAIHGYQKVPDFKRINVSYEAWELYIMLNDPDTTRRNMISVGMLVSGLLSPKKGYYAFDSIEVQNQAITGTQRYMEYGVGMNIQRSEGWLCSEKWMNILSFDINNRVQYNYNRPFKEKRRWSMNLLAGYRFTPNRAQPWITQTGFFLRYYAGLNPHGMFRSEYNHQFIGVTTLFSLH